MGLHSALSRGFLLSLEPGSPGQQVYREVVQTTGTIAALSCGNDDFTGGVLPGRSMVTGAHSDRPQLLKSVDELNAGDVVTVTRIDRLARSTFDLFGIVKCIVDAKAQFRSLAEHGPTPALAPGA